MIINLRGANGSGKSTVAYDLMAGGRSPVDLAEYITRGEKEKRVEGYGTPDGVVCVGKYLTDCGGCDSIRTQDLICDSVLRAAVLPGSEHVLFEGVIVSTIFSRYLWLDKKFEEMGHKFVWAFLDTPVEVCLERIYKRNGGKEIKEQLVHDKIKSIKATRHKAKAIDRCVVDIDHTRATDHVRDILSGGL